uniref:Starch-binding domain-containing protein 1 n=1 Tax=Anas platyrhynchos platyrhynchos TaxID=8840 RepID=A0A493T4J3_ANAPP
MVENGGERGQISQLFLTRLIPSLAACLLPPASQHPGDPRPAPGAAPTPGLKLGGGGGPGAAPGASARPWPATAAPRCCGSRSAPRACPLRCPQSPAAGAGWERGCGRRWWWGCWPHSSPGSGTAAATGEARRAAGRRPGRPRGRGAKRRAQRIFWGAVSKCCSKPRLLLCCRALGKQGRMHRSITTLRAAGRPAELRRRSWQSHVLLPRSLTPGSIQLMCVMSSGGVCKDGSEEQLGQPAQVRDLDQEEWEVVSEHLDWGEAGRNGSVEDSDSKEWEQGDCPDGDLKAKRVAAVPPMFQNIHVTFRVHYITHSDAQLIGVTGDHECLGQWHSYVPLKYDKDGFWSESVSLPVDTKVEWKFILVENGKVTRWEECSNRTLVTEHEDRIAHQWWGHH